MENNVEMKALETKFAEVIKDLTTFQAKAQEEIKTIGTETTETKSTVDALVAEKVKMQTQLDALDAKIADRHVGGGGQEQKSIGQLLTENAEFLENKAEDWGGTKGLKIRMDTSAFPGRSPAAAIASAFSHKANITNVGLGTGTSGISMPQDIGGRALILAQQELRIRDVISVRTMTDGNMFMYTKQSTRTNAASPQAETSPKAESTYAWDTVSGLIRTIAHYTNVSRQALDDISWLRSEIDGELMYGLLLKEEQEILSGSGTGEHLNGILTQASLYNTALNVAGDTGLDKLRHAKLQARLAGLATFRPTAFVLNPTDMHTLELIKDQASNVGNYVIGDPKTGTEVKFVWGLPVVESDSISAGTFLVGAFATAATLIDRMKVTVDISFEHDQNFTKNLATILAEERIGLAVKRPTAFIYGNFATGSPAQ